MSVFEKLINMPVRASLHGGVLAAVLLVAMPAPAAAQARPWPSVSLTRVADGQAVLSSTLARTDGWVVAVVRPRCEPCRTVVRRLAAASPRPEPGRVVVILSGLSAAEAAGVRAEAPGLPASAWHSDAPGALATALDLQSGPAVMGLRGTRIEWTLIGSLFTDAQWQGVVGPWLR
jgi:hypothetical protein